MQEQDIVIRMSNKLHFFMKFYRAGGRPKYAGTFKSRDERSWVTRLRVSIHKLAIEKWKVHKCTEGFCQACNSNEIEDEEHFLLKIIYMYQPSRQILSNNSRNII